jgi:hypothetical protein
MSRRTWLWLGIPLASLFVASIAARSTFRGQMLDIATHRPVAGLRVAMEISPWWNPFVNHEYMVATDQDGRFTVASYYNDSGSLVVLGEQSYAPIQLDIHSGSSRTVLVKSIEPKSSLGMFHTWIGTMNGRPFGWNFDRDSATVDPADADIFPVFDGAPRSTQHLSLRANAQGSIAVVDASAFGLGDFVGFTLLYYVDTVPDVPFASAAKCDLANDNRWIFVKTAAGRFAKIVCNRNSFITSQSASTSDWAIGLQTVYNPTAGRVVGFTGNSRPGGRYSPYTQ